VTRQRAFTTAAARRRANPIEFVIDDVTVRLRASVDLVEMADMIEALQAPTPEGMNEIRAAQEKRLVLLDLVRTFLEPGAHAAFQTVADDLDFMVLTDMVEQLIEEYTGQANPTQAQSSSDGSSETGNSSTDTAPSEA
jgi:hypothetical protein